MSEERRCIDYDAEARKRVKWLDETGGAVYGNLTVRDYFAAKVMGVMITIGIEMDKGLSVEDSAEAAYNMADAMMKERAK